MTINGTKLQIFFKSKILYLKYVFVFLNFQLNCEIKAVVKN